MTIRLIGSLLASAVFISAQVSAQDTPKKARIEGKVTSLSTGESIRKATLRLQMQPSQGMVAAGPQDISTFTSTSDAEGKFVFEDLDPGRYSLSAERAGFVRQNYGARSAFTGGTPLTISSGQEMKGLLFKMTPQGTIAGKVTDEDGDPLSGNAQVQVFRYVYNRGRRQLQTAGASGANAEGTFVIGNLPPGRYYLSASDMRSMMFSGVRERSGRKGLEEGYATTYYPNALEASAAAPIDVSAGSEIRGLEIRLRKTRVFHIRGKVVDGAGGGSLQNVMLMLTPKDTGGGPSVFRPIMNVIRDQDGSFEFNYVTPGTYVIQTNPGARINNQTTSSRVAHYVVTISDQSVDDVVVPLTAGIEISGTIKVDGAEPQQAQGNQPPRRPAVFLQATEAFGIGAPQPEFKDDRSFTLSGVAPEKFRVNVANVPDGTYVKAIRFGGQEVSQSGLDLTSGAGGTLEIVLSPNAADVSGVVRNADGSAVSGVMVSLWNSSLDLPRSANTDQTGAFKIPNLAPGEYRVVAWEEVEPGLAQDTDFRKHFESQATTVKLQDGSHENAEVKLISKDAIEVEASKLR